MIPAVVRPGSASPILLDANNNRSCVSRCLFGPAEPQNMEAVFEEHRQENRARFLERFGVDIENFDEGDVTFDEEGCIVAKVLSVASAKKTPSAAVNNSTGKSLETHVRAFKPYNKQPRMTEFFKQRKAAPSSLLVELAQLKATKNGAKN